MGNLSFYEEAGAELEKRLRLKTFPIAIKLMKNREQIPEESKRPSKDFGHHLSLCQSYQLSRREGTSITMLLEDMWCFEPVIGYGLAEPPEYFLEGNNRYPHDVESLEAGQHYAEEFPKLEPGNYIGVTSAPLATANFEPDLTMIYCDSEQLSLLLLSREYKHGYNLSVNLSSHAACVYGVVPALQDRKCQVAVPCRGDRYSAMAESDELIFTIPSSKLKSILVGLRHLEKFDSKLPKGYELHPEYPLPESYKKAADILGYLQ